MNIGVIGLGIVGSAYKDGFTLWGHAVVGYDKKGKNNFSKILNCDLVFICVPTPSKKDGSCDISIIASVLSKLSKSNYSGEAVICSTVEPGSTNKLQLRYKNLKISCVPEILRERCAFKDFVDNSKVLVIGTNRLKSYHLIKKCFSKKMNSYHTTPEEAEIFKYFNNTFAALKVVYGNIIYDISKKFNANYSKIKKIYIATGKTKDFYLDVNEKLRGYAGVCLPKDTLALSRLIKKKGLKFSLINSIHRDNLKLKKTVFKGMRKK